MSDFIREFIRDRAESIGYSPYRIAVECEPNLDPGTVSRYLRGKSSMTSQSLSRILKVLRIELVVTPETTGPSEGGRG